MTEKIETDRIIKQLCDGISPLFPDSKMDVILFGSYARGTFDEGSDIDLMLLVDSPSEEIAQKNWQIGDIAGELLVEYGIQISPIVENRSWFTGNADVIPLFRNILREGVRVNV